MLCSIVDGGITRLSACYNFNKSIYFTYVTTSFPDETDYHGRDKERRFSQMCVFSPQEHTDNKPMFDGFCGERGATGGHPQ
jgi:hypothetical protein